MMAGLIEAASSPLIPIGIPVLTLVAAFIRWRDEQIEHVFRLVLLVNALLLCLLSMVWSRGTVVVSTDWLLIPGAATVALGLRLEPVGLGLSTATGLLSLVTAATMPAGWRRVDRTLLLTVSAAAHLAILGDHLLLRLAAVETISLGVLLLLASRGPTTGLVTTQRIAGGALLIAAVISCWGEAATRALEVQGIDQWVPGFVVLGALALGGALPLHGGHRRLADLPASPRAHISGVILLVCAGLLLNLDHERAPGLDPVVLLLYLSTFVACALALVTLNARRSQLWMWAGQFSFLLALTLQLEAAVAAVMWVCVALIRPAAAHAVDIVEAALGDPPHVARRWGGLASALPAACWLGVIAGGAIAGLPPFGLFAGVAMLLTALPPTPVAYLLPMAMAAWVALPALRLGLWPFIGSSRSSVLAPTETTHVSAARVGILAAAAIIGLGWPLKLLLISTLPDTTALLATATLGLTLLVLSLLLGRLRTEAEADDELPAWRRTLDAGVVGYGAPGRWLTAIGRFVAWSIDLLSLLPGALASSLRAAAWLVAWFESRPLWWAGFTVIGLAAAMVWGRGVE